MQADAELCPAGRLADQHVGVARLPFQPSRLDLGHRLRPVAALLVQEAGLRIASRCSGVGSLVARMRRSAPADSAGSNGAGDEVMMNGIVFHLMARALQQHPPAGRPHPPAPGANVRVLRRDRLGSTNIPRSLRAMGYSAPTVIAQAVARRRRSGRGGPRGSAGDRSSQRGWHPAARRPRSPRRPQCPAGSQRTAARDRPSGRSPVQ